MGSYLWRYGSELVVTVQVEFSAVGVAAEVQRLVPINGEAQNAQEEHPHRAEEQGVELANDRRRPELQHKRTHTIAHIMHSQMQCQKYTHKIHTQKQTHSDKEPNSVTLNQTAEGIMSTS